MPTLANFDGRSLALDFSGIQKTFQNIRAQKFAEKQLALREEIQRGTLSVAEAELILKQDASQLNRDKFEAERTDQGNIQDVLGQFGNPNQAQAEPLGIEETLRQQINGGVPGAQSQDQQIVPTQNFQGNAGAVPQPQARPAPQVDFAKRDALMLKLLGIKGGSAIAQRVAPILKGRDERAKVALQKDVEKQQAFAVSLSRKPREEQDRIVRNEMAKQQLTGKVDPFLVQFRNMNDADREQELFLDMAQADALKKVVENELAPATPTTEIGKAVADERAGFLTKAEVNTIRNAPIDRQSKVGKLFGDRDSFPKNSIEWKALDTAAKAEGSSTAPKLSDVGGIRKEFSKGSGNFIIMRDAIGKMRRAAEKPSAFGDLSLIFGAQKINDPGSVVRESEFAIAAATGAFGERIAAMVAKVVSGEKLSDSQRADLMSTAEKLFSSQLQKQIFLEDEFGGIAERASINRKDVVVDYIKDDRPSSKAKASSAGKGSAKIGRFNVKVR